MILFHVVNGFLFNDIGIFPIIGICSLLVFFEKPISTNKALEAAKPNIVLVSFLSLFFLLQFLVPLRHLIIPGDVEWNKQGYYFSWRMKSASRIILLEIEVLDKKTGTLIETYKTGNDFKIMQIVARDPYMVYQFAHNLQKKFALEKAMDVNVRAKYGVSLNGRKIALGIDSAINLDEQTYSPFKQNSWIMPSPRN